MVNSSIPTMTVSKNIYCPYEVNIGNNRYLVERDFLGIPKQTLYSAEFQRCNDFASGVGVHFEYSGVFFVKDKLLEVGVKYFICYGPLGDRLNISAEFGGESVGKFNALKSYAGGGSKGDWPNIKKNDWQIVFNLEHFNNGKNDNKFSIEYYENLFPALKEKDCPEGFVNIGYDKKIISKEYAFEEIQQYKRTIWEVSVIDNISGDNLGVLSYCEYTGFNYYNCSVYGSFTSKEWSFYRKEGWIGRSKKRNWLSTIELNRPAGVERQILAGKCHMSITKEEFDDYKAGK